MTPDAVIIVDWSGGADRGLQPKKDAIWIAEARNGRADAPQYMRNRVEAEAWLSGRCQSAVEQGERLFVGFDFPFGYPTGFAEKLTGHPSPFTLWDWLEARQKDTRDAQDRWELAAQMNAAFPGDGPFWFHPPKMDVPGLPLRKPARFPVSEWRRAETVARGTFSCWQLGGAGAVGSQVLTGLPVLNRLRHAFPISVWPFEQLEHPIAFVEVWPSLIAERITAEQGADEIKDAAQVRVLATRISSLASDRLAAMLDVSAPEEGWIFGLGYEEELAGALPRLRNDCFALPQGVHWTPVADALAHLNAKLSPVVGRETLAIQKAVGRVLADPAIARRSNPPHANAAVDGYGFAGGLPDDRLTRLPLVSGRAAAGAAFQGNVPPGRAVRVLTGAPVPQGVDTVVLEEDVRVEGDTLFVRGPLKTGSNTRKAGEDVTSGQPVLDAGTALGAAEMALLAAAGISEVFVHHRLRVAILSTGDELVESGAPTAEGQIADANRPLLKAMATRWGYDVLDLGILPDNRTSIRAVFDEAARNADVLITSGGASAGDEDHVSALLTEAGAMEMWRIAVKPGRPLALGLWDGLPVFGLPGNPVAAMVCAAIFARPALQKLSGAMWQEPQGFTVPAAFSKSKKPGRSEYQRARIVAGRAEVFPSEGSGRVSGLAWADGLVALPHVAMEITPGTPVTYIPWSSFGL